ncbi:unnamed protein product (macronuclear) [Paramecium tetraurelia]|uniref:Uncharacterized protein n=1 Tax=Paramecium tetraurelia TaxID=5888 RepID=A0CAB8_PARTE|nr:uncharacterized protein GSPATT00036515001 [Paramecium tetraurelia]CAK67735.1 unnamed protein product [Paramecium tetraurelia]|eukprot:XP_001435132.1 hypothetical protein (macronuclear) [Paramecium tetraurelia strain d4-2]
MIKWQNKIRKGKSDLRKGVLSNRACNYSSLNQQSTKKLNFIRQIFKRCNNKQRNNIKAR